MDTGIYYNVRIKGRQAARSKQVDRPVLIFEWLKGAMERLKMGLNKSSGNMYSWITKTWNPIRGICPHQCNYCYVKRSRAKRLYEGPPKLIESQFKKSLGKDNFIFVGSMIDIFAAEILEEWILRTLKYCQQFKNTYLFQSKNPKRIWELRNFLPIDSVVGTTIETDNENIIKQISNAPKIADRIYWMEKLEKYKI